MGDNALTIDSLNTTSFPYVWLRDSCQSDECIHPTTTQKLHQSSDIPLDIKPVIVQLIDETSADPGMRIQWQDDHVSIFRRSFLARHVSTDNLTEFHKDVPMVLWDKQKITGSPALYLEYDELKTPGGLLRAIDQLCQYGLVFIRSVPNSETDIDKCEVRKLASMFGYLRDTFYGEIWNVVNKNSENLAYTNLKLSLHTDLSSFESPPRYQILHCIRNRVDGGVSIFVDAFRAATQLRNTQPTVFNLLASTPVPFQYIHDGHHLHYSHPTIELDPLTSQIRYVHYSPPFQGPLPLSTPLEFYSSLKSFDGLLSEPQNAYEYTLQEGDAVIFDNRRILHSRTAFKEPKLSGEQMGTYSRWLQGCYFESETMQSRGRVLRAQQQVV